MTPQGRTVNATADAASDVAAELRDTGFVRFVSLAEPGALAATGMLAAAVSATRTPFQVSVARTDGAADARVTGDDTGIGVGVGTDGMDPAVAFDVARHLGHEPDPIQAFATAPDPASRVAEYATEHVRRRPGIATPTTDLLDGLAHSTLLHASFSGDVDATEAFLAALDVPDTPTDDDHRRVASAVTRAVVADENASQQSAVEIERALRPFETHAHEFTTIEGYRDVLGVLAERTPGTAVALALGYDVTDDALDTWRETTEAVHDAVRTCRLERYSEFVVAHVEDAPVGSVARVIAGYRSPEPVVVAIADTEAAVASTGNTDASTLAADVAPESGGSAALAFADIEDPMAFIDAIREHR